MKNGTLIIARHGESEWNALGKWTGSTDVHLTEKGFLEAKLQGEILKDVHIDQAYCSQQIRAIETLETMLDASGHYDIPFERSAAINERDYGIYTGKNKWEVQKEIGEEAFNKLRRDWDYPVTDGETLKDVYARSVPFYTNEVVPKLSDGKSILIVAHGNSIRSLIKYIESIEDASMSNVEMLFGKILFYETDAQGKMVSKREEQAVLSPTPA